MITADREQVRGELCHDLGVAAPVEGSVQVDQVDPFGSRILPPLGSGPWVAEPLFRAGAPLNQLHRLSSCNIHGRQQNEPVGASRSRRGTCRMHQMTLSPAAS